MESREEMIAIALNMRANWIETGNPTMSRNDAIRGGAAATYLVKALEPEQEKLVLQLRETAKAIYG
jgi:hypothetical protein